MENLEINKALDNIETNITNVQNELKNNQISTKAFEEKLKELGDKQVELAKQLQDTAQSIDSSMKQRDAEIESIKSVGERAAAHESLKGYKSGAVAFTVKANVLSGAANSITRDYLNPAYQAGMVTMPDRAIQVENLFPHIAVSTDSIEYLKEGNVETNAKVTKEGAKFAEATITKPTLHQATAVSIGSYAVVSHQLITNEQAFAQYVNTKMQYKLNLAIDNMLVNGAGTATELGGIMLAANHTDATAAARTNLPSSGATLFDLIASIKNEFTKQYINPEYILLNPDDWLALTLLKDAKANYLLGGPQALASKTLWGVRVIDTPLVEKGKYVLGNFTLGGTVYDREALEFKISDQDSENFKAGLYTLRVTRRLAFAIENPLAIFAGDLSLTAGA